MSKKPIKFYVHQLIIDESSAPFTASSFESISESDTETFDMQTVDGEKEILSVKKITKTIYEENRFIGLAFDQGEKYPYSPKVVNKELDEEDNPRSVEQIELDQQFFALIDVQTQRIWISSQQKKNSIVFWLKEKIKKEVIIKSIINDGEFIQKIKSVKEISFTVVPDLFNSENRDTLSSHLVQDILGFGAKKAKLLLEFNNSQISDKIKTKLNDLLGRKHEFKDITVIGRSDEDFESTFNLEEITSKVIIDVPTNEIHKLFEAGHVFDGLIKKIKGL